MSNVANLSDVAANAEASALATLMNSGSMAFYSGTQPVNANTALTGGNTLLATVTLANPAFGAPSAGIITANSIGSQNAIASGTATFARVFKSDGTTTVMDVAAGTSGAGVNLSSTAILSGQSVSISSWTHDVTENS